MTEPDQPQLTATTSDSPEPTWAEVGDRLRRVREYLNLSQQVVSTKTGIARSAVSDIERGHRKVDSLELRKLARLYSYPMSYFVGGDPNSEGESVAALGRALTTLTEADRDEVMQFAQFLRFQREGKVRGTEPGAGNE